ncbi:hypothetical protein M758_9G018000 [Ceratodon purpureus]|nr:hypothetical protein M758_9G018000 [Ceratodon purpureus]
MISVEDVEDLNIKLTSDRAKVREDGVKALGSYLEGAAGLSICPLLDQQTALLRANDRIASATWPGVLNALCECIVMEVAASKKRGPKPFLAKTLRNFVHKAEDTSRSGKSHFLLRKIKRLFQHILDMLQEVPVFSSDYSHILRELLPDVEYRLRMGRKIYNDFVSHYLAKAKEIVHNRKFEAAVAKEESFRNTLTLLILLQNPPGDLAAHVKEDIVDGFCEIFAFNRDEDRITKKLVSSLNAFLVVDGLNLGEDVVKLHSSFRPFMVRTWLTSRDRDLKDELVLYARMQLKLQYIVALDDGSVVEELVGLVEKELDQTGIALTGYQRYDIMREDKVGSVSRSEKGFLEFAAATFFEVGKREEIGRVHGKASKRRRKESVYALVGEKITAAKILWDGAFCILIRNFGPQLPPKILEVWLDGLSSNLERVMSEGVNTRSFGAPVWTLRCLQELSNLWRDAANSSVDTLSKKPVVWKSIWESLLHWIPLITNVPVMVDEAFRLLGLIATMRLVPVYNIPPDFWELQMFSEVPSGNLLYFIAAFFACPGSQAVTKADLDLRHKLLKWSLTYLDLQEVEKSKGTALEATPLVLLSGAVLALSVGFVPLHPKNQSPPQNLNCASLDLTKELSHWAECKEQEVDLESMDRSLCTSPSTEALPNYMGASVTYIRSSPLPRSSSDFLLRSLSELLLQKVNVVLKKTELTAMLPYLFFLSGLLANCIFGVEFSMLRRGQRLPDWCSKGRVMLGLSNVLKLCLSVLENYRNRIESSDPSRSSALSASLSSFVHEFTPATLSALSRFLSSPGRATLVSYGGLASEPGTLNTPPIMAGFLEALTTVLTAAATKNILAQEEIPGSPATMLEERDGEIKLMDVDLDEFSETGLLSSQSHEGLRSTKRGNTSLYGQWKELCLKMIADIGRVLPERTCNALLKILENEQDTKVCWKIFLILCELINEKTIVHLPELVHYMVKFREDCQNSESARYDILTSIDALLTNLLTPDGIDCRSAAKNTPIKGVHLLPEEVLPQLASFIAVIEKMNLLLWPTRAKFVNTVFNYILVSPSTAQDLTEKLLGYMHDLEYRVRRLMSVRVSVFFQTWDGHLGLFRDLCANFGVKMVMVSMNKVVRASEVESADSQAATLTETALLTLGEIAASSDKVEGEALFMLCAHAALNSSQRLLVSNVLNRVANQLQYPNRWKYLDYVMGALLTRWVIARLSIPSLVQIKDVLSERLDTAVFLEKCCPWLLSSLFLHDDKDELDWIAKSLSLPLSALVRQNFASIFASLLLLHSHGTRTEQEKADAVLQLDMLAAAELTEDERDTMIRKHMIAIVSFLFRLCGDVETPQPPQFTKAAIASAVRTVVDGFLDVEQASQEEGVVDNLHVFRPDRVFMLLLQLHYEIDSANHPRHRRHLLASLMAIMTVIDRRVVVSSTCRYIVHIILQSIDIKVLQEQCCTLLGHLLDKVETSPLSATALGEQLQSIVSKLVSCITAYNQVSVDVDELQPNGSHKPYMLLVGLLERLTVNASHTLHDSIKELNPFPELPVFEPMRALHNTLCSGRSLADEFVQFVKRAPSLPSALQLSSLQSLANELKYRKGELYEHPFISRDGSRWRCSSEVVSAAWRLVQLCDEENFTDMRDLAGIFLAAVGMGDPHAVVFHLPEGTGEDPFLSTEVTTNSELGASDILVKQIMLQMRGYLVDNDVEIIELTSKTLKGLLSTDQGHRVLKSMTSKESAYLEVHSKGINSKIVEDMLSTSKQESASIAISAEEPQLWRTDGKAYNLWICELVHSLIEYTDDQILRISQRLVLKKASLAELVFSHLLGNLAARNESDSGLCKIISKQVEEHILGEQNQDMRSIQLFLGALNTLRCSYVATTMKGPSKVDKLTGNNGDSRSGSARKRKSGVGSSDQGDAQFNAVISGWQKVYWLQVDYLTTAGAAQRCAAYFTSILYVEHWCKDKFGSLTLGEPDFSMNNKLTAHIELLLSVYTKINEPDGVYGVARSHKVRSQLLTYEHEGNWSKAVETYDLLLRSRKSPLLNPRSGDAPGSSAAGIEEQNWQSHKGLMRSLRQMGCTYVVDLCNQSLAQHKGLERDPEFRELQYEAAWRSCHWDDNLFGPDLVDDFSNTQAGGQIGLAFHAHLHSCLRALVEGDAEIFYPRLQQARQGIITSMTLISMESTRTVNPAIMKLQMLECLSQSWEMRWRLSQRTVVAGPLIPSDNQVYAFEDLWQENIRQMESHYDLLEPYITFRKVLFHVLNRHDFLPRHLLEFSTLARKAGRRNQAADSIHELKLILSGSSEQSETSLGNLLSAARVEEAKILWAQDQQEMAVNLMKYILQHSNVEAGESAVLHCLTGKWLAETRSDSFRVILDLYLGKSVELVEGAVKGVDRSAAIYVKWAQRLCRTHYRLAQYTDNLFKSYEDRLISSEWQAALRLRQHKSQEFDALKKRFHSQKGDARDISMKIFELQKQLALDDEEAQRMEGDKDQFLGLALESYRSCLLTGNKYDLRVVFRLLSLWFNLSTNPRVVDAMLETVKKVQSYKFVPLVYQIASRMGSSKEQTSGSHGFQYALSALVERMAVEHPYHTMYQIFALANGDRVKANQRGKIAFVVDMDKKHTAEQLLKKLSAHHKDLLIQMRRMVEIYIKLAELETKKEDTNKKIPLPREIRSVRQLELVPVITAHIPVDPGCQYQKGSLPYYKGLSDTVQVMNGINAPKVVECKGSDGRRYKQLAKSGNDDLRQDAVMEQLFGLVNTLLQDHSDTRKRQLGVRTYKVVPFTPSAGVLEWVDGTIPLGEYLLGSSRFGGAHLRYGGNDWSFMQCREHMSTEKDKRQAFDTVCKKFRPVLHNFFLEKFTQAADWFEKRLAYTRSVAASSMVGYVVGLGDRHSMNILLDQVTAEVVHIDLGVAFEQGLMLKTPERVPFRLTRDIIDGMGVSGVEGVFRRCCEATLSVMRTNKDALLTIIEVFIYDPLYKWALSPLKALQRQRDVSPDDGNSEELNQPEMQDEGNKDAARALLRVKQKLDGYEGGEMRSLQGQVQQLVQDAQDPERLSHMFPGWGAWL